jgi:hypothetical protein
VTGDDPLSSIRSHRPVDAGFADRLESSLRIQHAAGRPAAPVGSPWRRLLLVGPAIVLVVLASAVLVLRDDAQSSALELHEAHNVVVTLPDGTVLVDPVGLELLEGTVVTVGPGGRAVIDDFELGPGSMVTVLDGALVTAEPATTTSSAPSDETATDRSETPKRGAPVDPPSEGRSGPASDPDRDRVSDRGTDPAPPVTTERPDREATDGDADRAPGATVAPDPGDGRGDVGDGDVDVGRPRIDDLELTARVEGDVVVVGWRATGVGLAELRVVLLRSHGPDGPDPDWPRSGTVTIVGETTGSEPGEFREDVPASGVVVRYRAVALVGDDVVARSVVRTPVLDR